ncbi:MAG: ATP-grasp domain-containing protein [Pseudomonadota bacterium]
MDFCEHVAKPQLSDRGIRTPRSVLVSDVKGAAEAFGMIGASVVKAQVPTGKRGKAGGIKLANSPEEAAAHAEAILGMEIDGWPVETVLIEEQVPIARELYAAIIDDHASRGPMLLFSGLGGMDVEEVAERDPTAMRRIPIDLHSGPTESDLDQALDGLTFGAATADLRSALGALYQVWRDVDAELVEINPLVITSDDHVYALDCKLTIDDSSAPRQAELAKDAAPERQTELEQRAAAAGLKYIELDGSVGVLANGAGLTMTTMDVIAHYGGRPANFMEIGGEAYTKATTALGIVLDNPNVKALLVNFCGAFARTDVMAEGVVKAWEDLKPDVPVFFTIHGTGEDEAITLVQSRLGITPFDLMDDAVKAAVSAAAARD